MRPFNILVVSSLVLVAACGDDGAASETDGSSGMDTTSTSSGTSTSTDGSTTTSTTDPSTSSSTSGSSSGDGSTGVIGPEIDALSPTEGIVTTVVNIAGANFGVAQGTGTVTVGGVEATVTSWSDIEIEIEIPDVMPGARDVEITTDLGMSNAEPFEVLLPRVVYVQNEDLPETVSAYALDAKGALSSLTGSPYAVNDFPTEFGGGLQSVVLSRSTRRLFVAADDDIAVFDIDAVSGELTAVPSSPFAHGESTTFGMSVSPDGSTLYASTCNSGLSALSVSAAGALTPTTNSPFTLSATTCADNALLMHDGSVLVSTDEANQMYVFTVEGVSGDLMVTDDSPLTIGTAFGAEVDPTGTRLLVADYDTTEIAVYEISNTGVVTEHASSPFAVLGATSDIHAMTWTPDGARMYLCEYSGDQLWAFAYSNNGGLSVVGGAPWTMTGVSSCSNIAITRDGEYLVVADDTNDDLRVMSIAGDGSVSEVTGSPFTPDATQADVNGLVIAE